MGNQASSSAKVQQPDEMVENERGLNVENVVDTKRVSEEEEEEEEYYSSDSDTDSETDDDEEEEEDDEGKHHVMSFYALGLCLIPCHQHMCFSQNSWSV